MVMNLKLKDEKSHQRELRKQRNVARNHLEQETESKSSFKRVISTVNREARIWRKLERGKYTQKGNHLRDIKEREEIEKLTICPPELEEYSELMIFNREKMESLKKEKRGCVGIQGFVCSRNTIIPTTS